MKRNRSSTAPLNVRQWIRIAVAAVILAAFGWLYLFRLESFQRLSPTETAIRHGVGFSDIIHNPLNLGFKLIAFVTTHIFHGEIGIRLAAVFFAALSIALFFLVCRKWHGSLTAAAATILFGTSTWMLATGRFGASYMYLTATAIGLLASVVWLKHSPEKVSAFITFVAACALSLFTPGGVWFVIAMAIVMFKPNLALLRKNASKALPTVITLSVVTLGLLAISFVQHPHLAKEWLGLPTEFPNIATIGKQLVMSVSFLAIRGPVSPEIWLAHTPVLDAAALVFLLLGVILYGRHLDKGRTHLVLALLAPAVLLITLNGASGLAFMVPVAYILVAAGVAYMIHQWIKIFPRNPIAHTLATIVFVVLLGCVVRFHVTRYMVAWHYSPQTTAAYKVSSPGTMPDNLLQ